MTLGSLGAQQGVPSGTGVPLLGVLGASALPSLLGDPPSSWGYLWCCQDEEQPAWLLGSDFGSPGASGVWQEPSGVGEADLGSLRAATNQDWGSSLSSAIFLFLT